MQRYLNILQKIIIYFLLIIISVLLIVAILDVIIQLYEGIIANSLTVFVQTQFSQLIGLFLTILIGVELLEAVKAFLKEDIVHVEIVVLVAIIAISRKVIVMEISAIEHMELIALAIMLIALAATYWVIKICYKKQNKCKSKKNNSNKEILG
ncbi:MAG: phosphate-starvation-inducible PsiE family protein [Bacteroidales bacterium]